MAEFSIDLICSLIPAECYQIVGLKKCGSDTAVVICAANHLRAVSPKMGSKAKSIVSEEDAKATKIQAAWRGYLARRAHTIAPKGGELAANVTRGVSMQGGLEKVPESYVVVTENGIHNFEPSTHTDEGKAREYVASLVLCNWVLYRVNGGVYTDVYTEIDAGGFGLARPSIRWYVENDLAPRAAARYAAASSWEGEVERWTSKTRAKMAQLLFPTRAPHDQEKALANLLEDLQRRAPRAWVKMIEASEAELRNRAALTVPPVVKQVPIDLKAVDAETKPAQAAKTQAAISGHVQATFRGNQSRDAMAAVNQSRDAMAAVQQHPVVASVQPQPVLVAPTKARGAGMARCILYAPAAAVFCLYLLYLLRPEASSSVSSTVAVAAGRLACSTFIYTTAIGCALYTYLRGPYIAGAIASWLIKWGPQHGYPIGLETLDIRPWMSYGPLTLHLDVHASNFFMGNPPKIGCRDPDLVRVKRLHLAGSVELRTIANGLPIYCFEHILVDGVAFNLMIGRTGQMNLPAMGEQQCENELKEALGGWLLWPYRSITLPNVLRIRIDAARHLKALGVTNLTPRIEVSLRSARFWTPVAKCCCDADGSIVYRFGSEFVVPVHEHSRDGLLVVKVFDDTSGRLSRKPRLLGLWFMTVKYLILFPDYCKHSTIAMHGNGSIAGTFLLTDPKLHGSAMRVLGPSDLGKGYSGELDMAIHLTHSPLVDPCPPFKPIPSLAQLTANGPEDDLKKGNVAEMDEFLDALPIRFDIKHFTIRNARIDMTDILSSNPEKTKELGSFSPILTIPIVDLTQLRSVTMGGLIKSLQNQLLGKLVTNNNVLSSAFSSYLSQWGEAVAAGTKKMYNEVTASTAAGLAKLSSPANKSEGAVRTTR